MNAFSDAARVLRGEGVESAGAARVLDDFGLGDGGPHIEALLEVAARASRAFELTSPWAPGLCFVGATLDPASFGLVGHPAVDAGGCGLRLGDAFTSCMGEAAERLSALASGNEPVASSTPDAREAALFELDDLEIDWLPARDLIHERGARVPARRALVSHQREGGVGSTGCAAGTNSADAIMRGLLELIERDAAALWWEGGARPRAVALQDAAGAAEMLVRLRQGHAERPTRLLDITADLRVPVCAAISHDRDGRGLACGLSAGTTLAVAARSAVLELCQMELALVLARWKENKGEEASLSVQDRRHLRLACEIDAETCPLLLPASGPAFHPPLKEHPASLAQRLAAAGIDAFAVELTRENIGVPVARAVAPHLQMLPMRTRTRRLCETMTRTGGGRPYTNGADLL